MKKEIIYFGKTCTVSCDDNCKKAWGNNSRPRIFGRMLPDFLLGKAPDDPKTYEGGHGKPTMSEHSAPNKWCVRECERLIIN